MVIELIGFCTFSIQPNTTKTYLLPISLNVNLVVENWEIKENKMISLIEKHSSWYVSDIRAKININYCTNTRKERINNVYDLMGA